MTDHGAQLQLDLLGEITLRSAGVDKPLPASRKTRALLVYLALENKPHRRESLCDLLWARTEDPRAGLRWSLAKLRPLVGDQLETSRDTVALSLSGITTDLAQLRTTLEEGDPAELPQLEQIEARIEATYLPGIDCGDSPSFELWLESQRLSLRMLHARLLQRLCTLVGADPARALHFARRRVSLDHTNIAANLALLEHLLKSEGRDSARRGFEQCRKRLHQAHIDDAALLQGWRKLSTTATQVSASPGSTQPAPPTQDSIQLAPDPELPQKPSLAVLGFQEIASPDNNVLATGLTADLISRLSRVGGLFVIAGASSTRFAAPQYSFPEIGRLLGVRYLVRGTIQNHRGRLRINVELVDASDARGVWAESFERSSHDLFLLQDELANAIVSAVEPEIERAEYERARLKPPENLGAWENYHMALWHSFRFTAGDTEAAASYLDRALEQDPHFSRAHAARSLVHFSRAFLHSCKGADAQIRQALACAEQSVGLDNRDAMGHWSLGRAQFLSGQHDLALTSLERALHSNPNYAQGHYARGFVGAHAGVALATLPDLDAAQRLSPFDPLLFAMKSSRAVSLAMQENYEEAAVWAVRATLEANAHFHIYAIAGACLELAGRHDDAKRHLGIALERHPGYSQDIFFRSFPYKLDEQKQRISRALRKAGMA